MEKSKGEKEQARERERKKEREREKESGILILGKAPLKLFPGGKKAPNWHFQFG